MLSMSIEELIIVMVLTIEFANVAMIAYIFRWARKAIANFKASTIEVLSSDSPETTAVFDRIAKQVTDATIANVRSHLLVLRKEIGQLTGKGQEILRNITEGTSEEAEGEPAAQIGSLPLKAAAGKLGMDPQFLKMAWGMWQNLQGGNRNQGNQGNQGDSW